jgi:hypothetical protein
MKKKNVQYYDNYKHLLQQVANKIVPKFIHNKKKIVKKNHTILFYIVILLAHCIPIAPIQIIF